MSNLEFGLTATQVSIINNLTDNGTKDFHKAYDFVYGIIKNQPSVNEDVKIWFQRASEINRNDTLSAANNFIRSGMTPFFKQRFPLNLLDNVSFFIKKFYFNDKI